MWIDAQLRSKYNVNGLCCCVFIVAFEQVFAHGKYAKSFQSY